MSRLRTGEWVAAISAVGLFITLFFDWFSVDGHAAGWTAYAPGGVLHLSGWGSLGWFMDVLLGLMILGGVALAFMNVRRAAPAWPVGASVLMWTAGTLIWIALAVRVATQPGLGLGLSNRPVLVEAPAYLGLLFAALIPLGAFLSLRDERTHTREARAYTPPTPRTAPGA
jgi:hypothetical protein